MSFKLFTASFRGLSDGQGVPIQISNGRPKFQTSYTLRFKLPALVPPWALVKNHSSVEEFQRQYWAQLDKIGKDALDDLFEQVAEKAEDERLILMCFEKSPRDCHRGDFSIWWRNNGGDITELA